MAVLVDKEKVSGVVEILACEFVGTEFELDLVVALDLGASLPDPKSTPTFPELIVYWRMFGEDVLAVGSISCPVQPSWMDVDCACALVANATRPIKGDQQARRVRICMALSVGQFFHPPHKYLSIAYPAPPNDPIFNLLFFVKCEDC
jgi:hypothetical protein